MGMFKFYYQVTTTQVVTVESFIAADNKPQAADLAKDQSALMTIATSDLNNSDITEIRKSKIKVIEIERAGKCD